MKKESFDVSCTGCGKEINEIEIAYTNDEMDNYCSDCYSAIQSDDESSGRDVIKQNAISIIGRQPNKVEMELLTLFGQDRDYEMYMSTSDNLAFRKIFYIGQAVNAFDINTKGVITLKEEGDYYVELSDGHGGWFNYKELEKA